MRINIVSTYKVMVAKIDILCCHREVSLFHTVSALIFNYGFKHMSSTIHNAGVEIKPLPLHLQQNGSPN